MSPVVPGKAKLGIQPYPVKDLKLDGYLPKVLYLPGDLSVDVSIIAGINGNGTSIPKVDDDNNLQVVDNSGKGTRWKKSKYIGYFATQTDTDTFTFDLNTTDVISVLASFKIVDASDPDGIFNISVQTVILPNTVFQYMSIGGRGLNSNPIFVSLDREQQWPIADLYRIRFVADRTEDFMSITGIFLTEHLV